MMKVQTIRSFFKPLSHRLLAGVIVLALVSAVGIVLTHRSSNAQATTPAAATAAYKQQLLSEVQSPNGAPIGGRDPARQGQTSLASVAAQPTNVSIRTNKPASKVVGTTNRHVSPASVLPNPKTTGVLSNGCLLGYGTPGAQCVPAHAAGNKPLNCKFLRTIFPNGVKINGTDYLMLGQGTGTACPKVIPKTPAKP